MVEAAARAPVPMAEIQAAAPTVAPAAAYAAVAGPRNLLAPLPKLVRMKPRPRLESLIEAEDPEKIEPFLPPYMIFVKKLMRKIEGYRSGRRPSFDVEADAGAEVFEQHSTRDAPVLDEMVPGYVVLVRRWLDAFSKKSHDGDSLRRGPDSRTLYLAVTCGMAMLLLAIIVGVSSPAKSTAPAPRPSAAGMSESSLVPRTRSVGASAPTNSHETIVIHATRESPAPAVQKTPKKRTTRAH
jgi:hypothetical protein